MKWDASVYDRRHGFVAEYGRALLELVPDDPALSVLDLGCGTGALTARLAANGRRVVGADSSPEMIERARAQYPGIDFRVCDALALPFDGEFGAVFSNAVFHWIGDHDALLQNIRRALKPGGLLICEFGAEGNVQTISDAFAWACAEQGLTVHSRFNMPSAEVFGRQLTDSGFIIDGLYAFDRPTPLSGSDGLACWMAQFFAGELAALPETVRPSVIARAEELAQPALWDGAQWIADYRRLRAVARRVG